LNLNFQRASWSPNIEDQRSRFPQPLKKHLLEPLKHEDGPKPRKPAKAKIWDERRVVARRVADLLHDMRIHMKNVPFASYAAVQKKWKKKYDALEASSSDSEPEPEPKRPKRSCRTPADE